MSLLLGLRLLAIQSGAPTTTPTNLFMWGDNTYGQLGTNNSPYYYSWAQIATGNSHTVGLRSDGALFGWGANQYYQVGDNTSINRSSPVQIGLRNPTSSFASISAGANHTLALSNDGTVWAWGFNGYGQLGNTSNNSIPVPSKSIGGSYSIIHAGGNQSAVIKSDKTLYTLGANYLGQLGDGTTIGRSAPTQIAGSFNAISLGKEHTLAITSLGLLYTWGSNQYNQLGDGTTISRSSPVQLTTSSFTSISAGGSHSLAVRSDGQLFSWGDNTFGQLGVNPGASGVFFTNVADGLYHSIALRNDGTLWSWGRNWTGQLGTGDRLDRSSPTQVGSDTNWAKVSAGNSHSAAIKTDGRLYTWGDNQTGQLGLGLQPKPVVWSTNQQQFGLDSTVLLKADGTLWFIGLNTYRQLGDSNNSGPRSSLVQIGTMSWMEPDNSWTQLASTSNTWFAQKNDGSIWGCGDNTTLYRLGIGDTNQRSSPTQVFSSDAAARIIVKNSSLAILDSQSNLYLWGDNTSNKLGFVGNSVPVALSFPVKAPGTYKDYAAAANYTLRIKYDGTLWFSGNSSTYGLSGRLDVNQLYSSPVQIGSLSNWTYVYANDNSAFAINSSYQLFAWGTNTNGTLGLNDVNPRSSPVQVPGSWSTIIANPSSTAYAIDTTGKLFAWGINTAGIVGDNSTINRSSPVQIAVGISFTNVFYSQAPAALDTNGTLWTWGNNTNGMIYGRDFGYSTSFDKSGISIPVQVGLFYQARSNPTQIAGSWATVSAGGSHTIATKSTGLLYAWGSNSIGQVAGIGPTGSPYNSLPVKQLVYGGLITTEGQYWAWGPNANGQIGDVSTGVRSNPVQIAVGQNFSKVNKGHFATYLIDELGKMWGAGQTGISPVVSVSTVTLLPYFVSQSWSNVSASQSTVQFGHAINTNNMLYSWGTNSFGQLGLNDAITRSSPTQIGASSWAQVYSGYSTTYAIKADGTLWGWGFNSTYYELGAGSIVVSSRSSPVQIGTSSFIQVSAGDGHAFAITTDYRLLGWGRNDSLQIGPVAEKSWIAVAGCGTLGSGTGTFQASIFGIKSDGSAWGWGMQSYNQISATGGGSSTGLSSPVLVGSISGGVPRTDFVNVTATSYGDTAYYITSSNVLYSCGIGTNGQVGQGQLSNVTTLRALGSYTQVSAGFNGIYAIAPAGGLVAWGINVGGMFGGGLIPGNTFSNPQSTNVSNVSKVSSGMSHVGIIKTDGSLWIMGSNQYGQLGDGTVVTRSSPVQVGAPLTTSSFVFVKAGTQTTHAITTDGRMFAWGWNNYGQLGDGTTISRSNPVQIPGSWISVSASRDYTYNATVAIDSNNVLYYWGYATSVSTGYYDTANYRSSPVQTGLGTGVKVSTLPEWVGNPMMVLGQDGKIYHSGNNTNGTLGNGTTTTISPFTQVGVGYEKFVVSPVQIDTGNSYISVSCGQSHSMGVRSNNTVYTWGTNLYGGLAQRDITTIYTPTLVPGNYVSGFTQLWTSYLTDATGGVYPLGYGGDGQLGNFTVSSQTSPYSVIGIQRNYFIEPIRIATIPTLTSSFTFVSAGNQHSLAIASNTTLWACGQNGQGQLGNGSVGAGFSYLSQSATSTPYGWSVVSAGISNSVGIRYGTLYGWGDNTYGLVGDNTTTQRLYPTSIGIDIYIDAVVGSSTAMALKANGTLWSWGANKYLQLSDGTTNTTVVRSSPVQIGTKLYKSIFLSRTGTLTDGFTSAEGNMTAGAIDIYNNLYTWGYNANGQIGNNNV